MTTEEKAKAYDEALEKVQSLYEQAKKDDNPIWSTYEYLFPQVRESEDEKTRKRLIDFISTIKGIAESGRHSWAVRKDDAEMCNAFLIWLEKHKEHSMSAEEVLIKAGLKPYKDGNQWCILAGDNIQEGICGFGDTIDEALYQFLMEVLEMQKDQRPVKCIKFDNEFENQVSHLIASVFNGEHEYNEGFVKHVAQSLLGFAKKEQKPADLLDTMLSKDPHLPKQAVKYEQKTAECIVPPPSDPFIFNLHSIIYNFGKQIAAECLNTHILDTELDEYVTDANVDKYIKEHISCLVKYHPLQKPAEWSEEDERMRNQLIYDIEHHKKDGLISAKQNKATKALYNGIEKCYDEKIAWLKSLRPSWKPSEEEIEAVRYFVNKHQSEAWAATGQWKQFTALRGLLGNLEKLM